MNEELFNFDEFEVEIAPEVSHLTRDQLEELYKKKFKTNFEFSAMIDSLEDYIIDLKKEIAYLKELIKIHNILLH